MTRDYSRRCALSALFVLAACNSSEPTNNNNNNGNNTGTRMTATIDGQAFAAGTTAGLVSVLQSSAVGGEYILTGTQQLPSGALGTQLTFFIGNVDEPGTYPLGVDGSTVAGGFASVGSNGTWTTPANGASGTITITALTATHMAGTFSFTAAAAGGPATGTKVVTNGQFDAPFGNTAVIQTLADSIGSKMSATLNGAAWNGAIVSAQLTSTHLALSGITTSYNLSMVIPRPAAPGTYQLSNASGNILTVSDGSSASSSAPNCCYGIVGDVGTLTITSLTSTRIKGTFSATLAKKPGTTATAPLAITNGSFDIGLFHN